MMLVSVKIKYVKFKMLKVKLWLKRRKSGLGLIPSDRYWKFQSSQNFILGSFHAYGRFAVANTYNTSSMLAETNIDWQRIHNFDCNP